MKLIRLMTISVMKVTDGRKVEDVASDLQTGLDAVPSLVTVEQMRELALPAPDINSLVEHGVLPPEYRVQPLTVKGFLTEDEIKRARKIYREAQPGTFAGRCADEIIAPVMARINAALGQENDARFLAYFVENTFNQEKR